MSSNISEIKRQLQVGYQFIIEQGAKFAHYSAGVIKQSLGHIRQDARLAGVTTLVANVLFAEIASLLIQPLRHLSCYFFGPLESLSENQLLLISTISLTFFSVLVVGMNIGLFHGLQSPLTPLQATAISISTVVSYGTLRWWRAEEN